MPPQDTASIDGYVAGSDYPSAFHHRFQPTWMDAVLRLRGIAPPRSPRGAFTLVDLGCGDGLGLIASAVAHPEARFVGIDAMPSHVARGHALVARLGLRNVDLLCADFQHAADMALPHSDYVTAQGVLAWVSPANRTALLDLAARLLRPGGVFAVGYNALPGWQRIAPFQRLVRLLAQQHTGSPVERFEAAMAQAQASHVIDPTVFAWLEPLRERMPADYFAHEYLDEHWAPCWADEVIHALRARGCSFATEASTLRLRDDLTLKPAWRSAVAGMQDVSAREVAIDLLVDRWYRVDLYVRDGAAGAAAAEATRDEGAGGSASTRDRMHDWWRSRVAPERARWALETPAGRVNFDNRAARAILDVLQHGPARLVDVPGLRAPDLLNAVDALWLAEHVHPAEPPAAVPHAAALAAALADDAGSGPVLNLAVDPFGAFVPPLAASEATASAQRSSAENVSPPG